MKHKIVLTLLIFAGVLTHAKAQDCAVTDKKDPFTNQRIIETADVKVYGPALPISSGYFLSFSNKNGDFFVCLNVADEFVNPTGFSSVILKLSDGSLDTLSSFVSSGYNSKGGSSVKSYQKIDFATLNKLTILRITNIRFIIAGIKIEENGAAADNTAVAVDAEVSIGKADKIIKMAKCISSYK
jgi:hypothetical protein